MNTSLKTTTLTLAFLAFTLPAFAEPVEIDASLNGETVSAEVGQEVIVYLHGNPSTGYSWNYQDGPGTLALGEEGFVGSGPGGPVGSGGVSLFGFEPSAAGSFTLEFHYKRSWESGPPAETFSVTLEVGGASGDLQAIDDDSNGETVSVTAGQTVEIQLSGNATTGYKWYYKSRRLRTTERGYRPDDSGRAGAGGTFFFQFAPGDDLAGEAVELKFEYRKPGRNQRIRKRFTVTLAIELPAPAPAADLEPLMIEESQNGRTVAATVGQEVGVLLPANGSTGYRWVFDESSDLEVQDEGYVDMSGGRAGGGGMMVFEFAPTRAGTFELKFEYKRPWESGPGAETFTVTLEVTAPASRSGAAGRVGGLGD